MMRALSSQAQIGMLNALSGCASMGARARFVSCSNWYLRFMALVALRRCLHYVAWILDRTNSCRGKGEKVFLGVRARHRSEYRCSDLPSGLRLPSSLLQIAAYPLRADLPYGEPQQPG